MPTQTQARLPEQLQTALDNGLLKEMPITFLPFTRQQLRDWDYLFPYERQSTEKLLLYVASLSSQQRKVLFLEVVKLEEKMDVGNWQFSTEEQTILNASLLARSPYYQQWRHAVQVVFDAAEQYANEQKTTFGRGNRLIILVLPQVLPLDGTQVWRKWEGTGHVVRLDLSSQGGVVPCAEALLGNENDGQLLPTLSNRHNGSAADTWIVDAGTNLADCALKRGFSQSTGPTVLSYERLATLRENFSRAVNTMRKDLLDADAVYARLRKTDVKPWCPPEVASSPAIQEFLRSLYLSGNGALIFSNSFVEWSASEAIRRARPSFLMAQFGVRQKPKPFTSVLVFDNPDSINPLPAVDDLPGSASDAQMLAHYVWLAANRYEEYRQNTVHLCIAESLSEAYLMAPPEFQLPSVSTPMKVAVLRDTLKHWLGQAPTAHA